MKIRETTPGKPSEYRDKNTKAVRPREASTLILVRSGRAPKILMGKRAASHKFMPNKFVFPGGRLDLCDQRLKVPTQLNEAVMTRLRRDTRKSVSNDKLRGLALAAIRETFEETGLIIGNQTDKTPQTKNPVWQSYFNHGVVPPLEQVDFIARAVTPTHRARRFDTRFFMAYEECIHSDVNDMAGASGELSDLHWLTLPEARELDLPVITRWVIDLVEARIQHDRQAQLQQSAPYMRVINGKAVVTDL